MLQIKSLEKDAEHNEVNEPTFKSQKTSEFGSLLGQESVLKSLIDEYADQKRKQEKMLEFTLFRERQFKINGDELVFLLDSTVQQSQLEELRQEWNLFVINKLGKSIKTGSEIVESVESNTKPFSASDKFQFLSKEYPLIEELKRKLGLEIDY